MIAAEGAIVGPYRVGRLLGRDAFSEPTRSIDNEARPLRSADSAGRPIGLLTLAALFFLALAAHERYASRLSMPRPT